MDYVNYPYVLDPDLAIPRYIQVNPQGFSYHEYLILEHPDYYELESILRTVNMKANYIGSNPEPDIHNINEIKDHIRQAIQNNYAEQMLPMLDALQANASHEIGRQDRSPKKIIDTNTYTSAKPIKRQFYIPYTDTLKERHYVYEEYAGLIKPPRGGYTLPIIEPVNKQVNVRNVDSDIFAGSLRMLVRLRDGSLLEFFKRDFNTSVEKEYVNTLLPILDTLNTNDPFSVKDLIYSKCIDIAQGRPAYNTDKLIEIIRSA